MKRLVLVVLLGIAGLSVWFLVSNFGIALASLMLAMLALIKKQLFAFFGAVFLFNGKFLFSRFLFSSAGELTKRYIIERVFVVELRSGLIEPLGEEIDIVKGYVLKGLRRLPFFKQVAAAALFVGSLGIVGRLAGRVIALKTAIAKVYSFVLSLLRYAANRLTKQRWFNRPLKLWRETISVLVAPIRKGISHLLSRAVMSVRRFVWRRFGLKQSAYCRLKILRYLRASIRQSRKTKRISRYEKMRLMRLERKRSLSDFADGAHSSLRLRVDKLCQSRKPLRRRSALKQKGESRAFLMLRHPRRGAARNVRG